MDGFWIVSAIFQSKQMPHFWLHNKLWCFFLVAEYILIVWENDLFNNDFLLLKASFYWSLWKGGFEPGSWFQPHFAQPLSRMVCEPNWDCPSPYRFILVLREFSPNWGRYPASHFLWLLSGEIINHRTWFCLCLFTSSTFRTIINVRIWLFPNW
jgi:hypothetical protein